MLTCLRSGELSRSVALVTVVLILAVDAGLCLRLPTFGQLGQRRGDADRADEIFRQVLSSQSTLHAGLALGAPASGTHSAQTWETIGALGDVELAPAAQLRDPALATIFSTRAVELLPRLGRGPSVLLPPLNGDAAARPRAASDAATGSLHPGDGEAAAEHAEPRGEVRQQPHHGSEQLRQQQQQLLLQNQKQHLQGKGARTAGLGAADPPPPQFDVDEAFLAGQLASIAYCGHPDLLAAWNCSRCANVPGFQPYRVVYDPVWDLAAYAGYHAPWDAIVLSFRGTDSSNWGQWAENMRAWRTDHMYPVPDFPHALIHAGFYTLWTGSTLQTTFSAAVSELKAAHPSARLVATGHSMGGALAQLAGLEFKLFFNQTQATVYTFGAPRVGNLAYEQLFNSFVDVSWRFTHNRDIVPSVPLQLMGFHHVAREVWEVDVEDPGRAGGVERKLLLCDGTGEDPSCHNSACYLGLCTSIADHLVYLGLHMYQDSDEC